MIVRNLSFYYKRLQNPTLEHISFDTVPGKITGILGNNGAGKSTLLKCLCRILRPCHGSVIIAGTDILKISHKAVAKIMSFLPQETQAINLTVYDTVMMGRNPYIKLGITSQDREIVRAVIERMKLESIALRFLNELSGGERQKVMLARSLAQNPQVMLLDEPTSNLDLKNQHEVLNLVRDICRENGIIVIMVIHDINLALKYCDGFLLMKDHRLFTSGGQETMTGKNIESVYDIPVKIYTIENEKFVRCRI
jgi:iron complex transport system ATP-binding protein